MTILAIMSVLYPWPIITVRFMKKNEGCESLKHE